MKINIPKSTLSLVLECRDALSAEISALEKSGGELGKLMKSQSELTAAISKLESGDPSSARVVENLTSKRTQLSLVEKRIADIDRATPANPDEGLGRALKAAARAVNTALKPVYDAWVEEQAKLIRPLCHVSRLATGLIWQTTAAHSLGVIVAPRWGQFLPTMAAAKQALKLIGQIEAGEIDWTFDPKI